MIWISEATILDMEWLYIQRNQPELYEHGFTPRAVTWQEHGIWFDEVLHRPDWVRIFMIQRASDKKSVGMVRLERTPFDEGEMSVYILPSSQGMGMGAEAINLATNWGFKSWNLDQISAYIKEGNLASIGSFTKAGYTPNEKWSHGLIYVKHKEMA